MRDLLDGRGGPVRDIVTLNAAAALVAYDGPVAADLETQLSGALSRARHAIDSGAGKAKLDAWVAATSVWCSIGARSARIRVRVEQHEDLPSVGARSGWRDLS